MNARHRAFTLRPVASLARSGEWLSEVVAQYTRRHVALPQKCEVLYKLCGEAHMQRHHPQAKPNPVRNPALTQHPSRTGPPVWPRDPSCALALQT